MLSPMSAFLILICQAILMARITSCGPVEMKHPDLIYRTNPFEYPIQFQIMNMSY